MSWQAYLDHPVLNRWFYVTIEGIGDLPTSIRPIKADGIELTTAAATVGTYTIRPGALRVSDGLAALAEQVYQKAGVASPPSMTLHLCPGDFGAADDPEWLFALFGTEDPDASVTYLTADIANSTDTSWDVDNATGFLTGRDLWRWPGNECAEVSSTAAGVINVTNRAKYGSKASKVQILDGVAATPVVISTFPRTLKGRKVRVFMSFADMNDRIVASSLFTDDSVEIFRGRIREEPEIGAVIALECIGTGQELNRKIGANLAKSTVAGNPAPGSYFPTQQNLDLGYAVQAGAIFVSDNNRIPVEVRERYWDYAAALWVETRTIRLDGFAAEAPYLYDGSAEVKNCVLRIGQVMSYIVQGLDRIDWAGTYSLFGDLDFAENMRIDFGYGTASSPGFGSGKGLIAIRWSGNKINDSGPPNVDYYYEVTLLWDLDKSIGPALGCISPMDFPQKTVNAAAATIDTLDVTRKADFPAPAVYVPSNSASIPVVEPRTQLGEPDFASSGHVVAAGAICSYSGYSALTFKTGETIDGLKILTGVQTVHGVRQDIALAFSDEFLAASAAYAYTFAQLPADVAIYAETGGDKLAVRSVIYLANVTTDEAILTLGASRDGDGANGTYDTITGRNGAGIDAEDFHTLQLASMRNEALWWLKRKTYVIHKEQKFLDFLENLARLSAGSFAVMLAATSSGGDFQQRLGFTQIRQPTISPPCLSIGPAELAPGPGAITVSRTGNTPLQAIVAHLGIDPLTGDPYEADHTYRSNLQVAGGEEGEKVEVTNYDIETPAGAFPVLWAPIARALFALYSEPLRVITARILDHVAWKLKLGDVVKLTSIWIFNPATKRFGVTDRRVVVAGITRHHWGSDVAAEVVFVDFDQLRKRGNYAPVLRVTAYDGAEDMTLAAHEFTDAYLDNPSNPGNIATDYTPWTAAAQIIVYELGKWNAGDERGIGVATIGSAVHDGAALSAAIQSAITGGAEVYLEFVDYDDAALADWQKNWTYIAGTSAIGASSDPPFTLTA